MMLKHCLLFIAAVGLCFACKQQPTVSLHFQSMNLPSKASFRGMDGNNNQLWLAGSLGEIWKYEISEEKWKQVSPFKESEIQFRDVEVLGTDTVIVMTAGTPALLLRTINGGKDWDTVLFDPHPDAFFDGLAFKNKQEGALFGDPIDGVLQVYLTQNGGLTWQKEGEQNLPACLPMEAGFAASGSSICYNDWGLFIGLGGEQARIFHEKDSLWSVTNTPVIHGEASQGIYSIASNHNKLLLVGGQYDYPDRGPSHVTWDIDSRVFKVDSHLFSYCSFVGVLDDKYAIACGPNGIFLNESSSPNWYQVADTALHTMYLSNSSDIIYGSGADGRVFKITPTSIK